MLDLIIWTFKTEFPVEMFFMSNGLSSRLQYYFGFRRPAASNTGLALLKQISKNGKRLYFRPDRR